MNMSHRFKSLALLLCGLMLAPATFAQKFALQPVPSDQPPPARTDYATLLDAPSYAALKARAEYVGTVRLVPFEDAVPAPLVYTPVAKDRTSLLDALHPRLRFDQADNGTVRWLKGRLGRVDAQPGKTLTMETYTEAALQTLAAYRPIVKLDAPDDELRTMNTVADDLGYVHARFEQTYADLPVWGRDLYVHFNAEGEIYAVNGRYEPTPRRVITTPSLDADAAITRTIDDLKQADRWAPLSDETMAWLGLDVPSAELVLYPEALGRTALAYEVTLHPNWLEWYSYIIDAHTGAVLNRIARHCTLNHQAPAPKVTGMELSVPVVPASSQAGTFLDATATDLNGSNQNIRVHQADDGNFFMVWDLSNLNAGAFNFVPANLHENGGGLTLSANNTDLGENVQLSYVGNDQNTWIDPAAVSAHANMNVAFEYYRDKHNRNAINDQDQSIVSIVHATQEGAGLDNAFWTGRFMVYGDGAQAFTPLAGALDVAVHEMSHGVIEHSAGLVYQFQSGALNESFADVFGVLGEPNDFLLGEDIVRAELGVSGLRDLLNPDSPNLVGAVDFRQPATMDAFRNLRADQDNGGVHVNSGIPNRAAGLIIQALGTGPTEQIYYRALTNYMTRNSEFGDARQALEQAATDLFGANEVTAVQNAFDAVGITPNTGTGTGGDNNDVPAVQGGVSLITFMNESGVLGYVNPFTGDGGLFEDANGDQLVAFNDANSGLRSQISTPLDGSSIWFVGQDNKLYLVDLEGWALGQPANVFFFPDLAINQEGDIRNAVISPDGAVAALTSTDLTDSSVYVTDGQSIVPFPVEPETTQEGIGNESIQFVDVISWSRNILEDPRIAIDALNSAGGLGGGSFWSIYETSFAPDFSFARTIGFIPAQPSDISVGNIAYSNTDPDIAAFNVINTDGTWDVYVANFETGEGGALGIPSIPAGDGTTFDDAERPTFAPDDSFIAMSSTSFPGLLFFDGSTALQTANLGFTVFNPHWFVLGGQVTIDTEETAEIPSSVKLYGNYPNPFTKAQATHIRFELDAPMQVQVEVYDVMGRSVRTLAQGLHNAGLHDVRFEAAELPAGTYLVQLRAGTTSQTQKVVLVR